MKAIAVAFSAVLMLAGPVQAQDPTRVHAQLKQGDLAGNLRLLNLWGQRPEDVQRLYEASYNILSSREHATMVDVAEDPAIQQILEECEITHFGGPMLGAIEPHGARVWLRTCRPAKVQVRLSIGGVETTFGPVESTRESDLVAVVPVTGLEPGNAIPIACWSTAGRSAIPSHAAIVTTPEPTTSRPRSGSPSARASTAGDWATRSRPTDPAVASRQPCCSAATSPCRTGTTTWACTAPITCCATSIPPGSNLAARSPSTPPGTTTTTSTTTRPGFPRATPWPTRKGVRDVFRQSWNNPSYGFGDERRGVFFRTRIGPCDVIMLDNRYFRSGEQGSFLGEEQMEWLEAQLLDCKGPFIILSCGTMWSDYVSNGKDSWGRWDPEGRERIFQLIEKHRIGGVLLISGDRHGARGFRIPRPSGFQLLRIRGRQPGRTTRPAGDEARMGGRPTVRDRRRIRLRRIHDRRHASRPRGHVSTDPRRRHRHPRAAFDAQPVDTGVVSRRWHLPNSGESGRKHRPGNNCRIVSPPLPRSD